MKKEELDKILYKNTNREDYYLKYPGSISSVYEKLDTKFINGREVFCINKPYKFDKFLSISKDSRYTIVPYHVHENYLEINYIYSGQCTYIIDNKEVTLYEGDVCFFDSEVVFAKMKTDYNDIVINISLSHEILFDDYASEFNSFNIVSNFLLSILSDKRKHDNYLIFRTHGFEEISKAFETLLLEYYDQYEYSENLINMYIKIIFLKLLRIQNAHPDQQIVKISNKIDDTIIKILTYIENNYSHCKLEEIAEVFGYHPKYLSNFIKDQTGQTYKQIQQGIRMKKAAKMIEYSDISIEKIAYEVGYNNLTYFYKKFKEQYHLYPQEYRDQVNQLGIIKKLIK